MPINMLNNSFKEKKDIKNFKIFNTILLSIVAILFGYYIYQTIFISSGTISLINLKKEFLAQKDDLDKLLAKNQEQNNLSLEFVKENFKMTEIEKFDYIILAPTEFALISKTNNY